MGARFPRGTSVVEQVKAREPSAFVSLEHAHVGEAKQGGRRSGMCSKKAWKATARHLQEGGRQPFIVVRRVVVHDFVIIPRDGPRRDQAGDQAGDQVRGLRVRARLVLY
jgi:hypothetical protein